LGRTAIGGFSQIGGLANQLNFIAFAFSVQLERHKQFTGAYLHLLAPETAQLLVVNAGLVAAPYMIHFLALNAKHEAGKAESFILQVFGMSQL